MKLLQLLLLLAVGLLLLPGGGGPVGGGRVVVEVVELVDVAGADAVDGPDELKG